jgi:hypothetical protein
MYQFWLITFVENGQRAVMRHQVIGGKSIALLDAAGNFLPIGPGCAIERLPSFTSEMINYLPS